MAHHDLRTHPLVVRRVQVLRATDVTPRMRRVTLGGDQLSAFRSAGLDLPAFTCPGFDDHVKLIFSATGDVEGTLPVQRTLSIDWPPSEHRRGRDYTPRRWDEAAGELDLDLVLHGEGPAASWARTAQPGDDLWFVGPKSSTVLPADVDRFVLAGDETALPAIGRFLDERPHPAPAHLVVQVAEESARQELALGPHDTIRWVVEEDPEALEPAVRSMPWPDGRAYVWIAGESRSLLPLRRWLRHDRGLPTSHTSVTGYWTAQTAAARARARRADITPLDPVPWLATRAAVELGLLDTLGEHPEPIDAVATRLRVDATALAPLVDYLAHVDVLAAEHDDAGARLVRLGARGTVLQSDEHARESYFGPGHGGDVLPALLALADAVTGRRAAWQVTHGATRAESLAADPELFHEQMHEAETLAFVARGVLALDAWQGSGSIALTGPGAVTLARAAVEARDAEQGGPTTPGDAESRRPGLRISPRRAPEALLRDEAADLCPVEDVARADLAVSVLEAQPRDDAEVTALLADLASVADRCLVVEEAVPDVPGLAGSAGTGRAVRQALLTYGTTGASPRDVAELTAFAEAAGWTIRHVERLGWDYVVLDLGR